MCNVLLWPMHVMSERGRWSRKDIAERNTPSNGQRHSLALYQCKPDYYLGLGGHFTFYTPIPLIPLPTFLKLHLFWKQHKRKEGEGKDLRRKKKKRWKASLACRKHLVSYSKPEKKEIARRQNSYVLIYFIIRWAVACSGVVQICGSKTRGSRDISLLTFQSWLITAQ